jgi:hypothetical protein
MSEEVRNFLRKAVKIVKRSDMGVYEQPFKKKANQTIGSNNNNNSTNREFEL